MTELTLPARADAEKMKRDRLVLLARDLGRTIPNSITKQKLLDVLYPEPSSAAAERSIPVASAAAPSPEVVAAMRRFLAEPNEADQLYLREWNLTASPEEYSAVMAEASDGQLLGAALAPARAPARDADPIQRWKEAATSAEMEPYRPSVLPGDHAWARMQEIATAVSSAVALPPALRGKPADVLLLLLAGHDVGVAPTVALNKIHVIEGRPSMGAELMRALVLDAGHLIRPEVVTPTRVVMAGRRKGWPADDAVRCEWTLDRARTAKLAEKDVWKKYPEAMLANRATSELCRLIFPDVLAGVSYTPEELDADVDAEGEPVYVASTAERSPEPSEAERLDAEAREAGWASYPAEKHAHEALAKRVADLAPEQVATARKMREEQGWPVRPMARFDAFCEWVNAAEATLAAEMSGPGAADDKATRMAAARSALEQAERSVTGKDVLRHGPTGETVNAPLLNGDETDAEVVCSTCGNAALSITAIEHEEGCPESEVI